MGIDDLDKQYTRLKTNYDALVAETVADPSKLETALPRLQNINQQMANLLDQMITELQYARQGSNSEAYRDKLIETLTRIQSDYNGLKTNTDALQTLKRIRSFQDTSWQPTLNLYVALLILFGVTLMLVLLFRRQRNDSAAAPSTSPTAIPALT